MNKKSFITVSILLRGNELNPDYVSEILGIRSNMSQRKGEKRGGVRPNSKTYITRIGTWRVWVDNKSRAEQDMISEVPQMVKELLQMFGGRQEPLDKIAGVDEAYLDILILQHKEDKLDNTTEFILSKDQILRLSQLGLAICVTASFNEDK
jgi:Domain of unknown function (DUF4279)